MKLYYLPGACSLAPHIIANELGTAFTAVKVDRHTKQTDDGENYMDINAKGYVPALKLDNGTVITEAQVVLQFLADQAPERGLAPEAGTPERYKLQEWLSFVSTELHKNIGSMFNPKQTPEWRAMATEVLDKRLGWLEKQLQGREYVLDQFSVADAYLFTVLNWTGRVNFKLDAWPTVQAYHQRLSQRPSVLKTLKDEGLI